MEWKYKKYRIHGRKGMINVESSNAVIYARYSSHGQTEQSIEGQLRDCNGFAKREGYSVVGEYIDRALTGRNDDRPDFQRMIKDAEKKNFKFVIVWKLDRFARNRYDSADYRRKLKRCGVKLLSATEGITDTPEGIILEAMLEGLAEYYSENLSKHVKRGHRESALKGNFIGSQAPFGYKLVNKKLVIDENTSPIIKYVFEQYAAGIPKREIINKLNAKGIRNNRGKPLTLTSFSAALKNEKYIGIYRYHDIEVKEACPAIIDKVLFQKVQDKLEAARRSPASLKAREEYLLQGKAFCGYCGINLVGESGKSHTGEKYYYYACSNRKKLHTCKKKNEKKGFLEWYIVEQTVLYVLTPERMDFIADGVVAQYEKEFDKSGIKEVERQINKLNKEYQACIDIAIHSPTREVQIDILNKAESLRTQKLDLEIELSKMRIACKLRYTSDDVKAWLKLFCEGDLMDADFQKRIIDVFINSVYMYDDKFVIYYNIRDGKQVSYIEMLDSTEEPGADADFTGNNEVRISDVKPSY